jgi:hypothetical protein
VSDIGDQIEGNHRCQNCEDLRQQLVEMEREMMLFKRNAIHAQQQLRELQDKLEREANYKD